MGSTWCTTPAVIVAVGCPLSRSLGLLWRQAVAWMPSLDSPDMRAWLQHQHEVGAAMDTAVVVPVQDCPDSVLQLAHREVCVPDEEYAMFTAALPVLPM